MVPSAIDVGGSVVLKRLPHCYICLVQWWCWYRHCCLSTGIGYTAPWYVTGPWALGCCYMLGEEL
jgi:hypothetical protein